MQITDDMLPDEALVARMEDVADALDSLSELVARRKHLPTGINGIAALAVQAREIATAMDEAARSDDPVESEIYRGRRQFDGFITFSGVWFYPLAPRSEDVRHADIVQGLLHTCRYNGQLPRHLSVAEHSIKVAAITEHLLDEEARRGNFSRDAIPVACLHALLHDAHEAFTGDVIGPIKGAVMTAFGVPWKRVESAVQDAILTAYKIPALTAEGYAAIESADKWMLYCESIVLAPNSDYGFEPPPAGVDVIGRVKKDAPDHARLRNLFDAELRRLVKLAGGVIPEGAPLPVTAPLDEEPTETRISAAERLAKAIGDVVPGARLNDPPPPEKQEQYLPNLTRGPRDSDIKPGEWSNAIRSADVRVPQELMNEPEFRGEDSGDGGA